jgi:hypothetical protein
MQYPKSCTAVSVLMWCQAETIIRADFLIGRGIAAYFAPKIRFTLRSWATVGLRFFGFRFIAEFYIGLTWGGRGLYSTPMPNRNLNSEELKRANELLADIRQRLTSLAAGDSLLLFAYRRKIAKELGYDERGKPGARKQLKALKWGQQQGKCAHCQKELELAYSELDRKKAADGYTVENTELVHGKCHQERQAAKGYA